MDPLSIIASSVGLTAAITKTTITVTKFVRDVRGARSDLDAVARELLSLNTVLELLGEDVAGSENGCLPDTLRKQITGIITNCTGVVVEIQVLLDKHEGTKITKAAKWVAFGNDDMNKLRSSLEAHKSALEIALDMIALTLAKEIKADTSEILQDTSAIKDQMTTNTDKIIAEIVRLQGQLPKDAGEDTVKGFMLDRYLDNLTSYAETVCDNLSDGSITPHNEENPQGHILAGSKGNSLEEGNPPTTAHNDVTWAERSVDTINEAFIRFQNEAENLDDEHSKQLDFLMNLTLHNEGNNEGLNHATDSMESRKREPVEFQLHTRDAVVDNSTGQQANTHHSLPPRTPEKTSSHMGRPPNRLLKKVGSAHVAQGDYLVDETRAGPEITDTKVPQAGAEELFNANLAHPNQAEGNIALGSGALRYDVTGGMSGMIGPKEEKDDNRVASQEMTTALSRFPKRPYQLRQSPSNEAPKILFHVVLPTEPEQGAALTRTLKGISHAVTMLSGSLGENSYWNQCCIAILSRKRRTDREFYQLGLTCETDGRAASTGGTGPGILLESAVLLSDLDRHAMDIIFLEPMVGRDGRFVHGKYCYDAPEWKKKYIGWVRPTLSIYVPVGTTVLLDTLSELWETAKRSKNFRLGETESVVYKEKESRANILTRAAKGLFGR